MRKKYNIYPTHYIKGRGGREEIFFFILHTTLKGGGDVRKKNNIYPTHYIKGRGGREEKI